jgi:hypothetical protein
VRVNEIVAQIKEAAVSTGLVIKESKIKHMKINRNITNIEQDLIIDLQVFEGLQNFRYLDAFIN